MRKTLPLIAICGLLGCADDPQVTQVSDAFTGLAIATAIADQFEDDFETNNISFNNFGANNVSSGNNTNLNGYDLTLLATNPSGGGGPVCVSASGSDVLITQNETDGEVTSIVSRSNPANKRELPLTGSPLSCSRDLGKVLFLDDVANRIVKIYTSAGVSEPLSEMDTSERPILDQLSADGRYAVGATGSNVYLVDLQSETSTLVSRTPDGMPGTGELSRGSISGDGRLIVFESDADGLDPEDMNGTTDIFIFDVSTSTVKRIDVNDGMGVSSLTNASISIDGSTVLIHHSSGFSDTMYTYDVARDSVEPLADSNRDCLLFGMSGDASRILTYCDRSPVTGDSNTRQGFFLFGQGGPERIDIPGTWSPTGISEDGRWIMMLALSSGEGLVSGSYLVRVP